MNRFHQIIPPSFYEYFVNESEKDSFNPSDWILPYPWISMFIYTHIKSNFWGYSKNVINEEQPRVLQIGCAQGADSVSIANVLKLPMINGHLDIVDWFKGNLTVDKSEEWSYDENNVNLWKSHLFNEAKKFDVDDIITIHEGDSRDIVPLLQNNFYDIVFIDGGHEHNIVKSDIYHGYQKLKSGGIMILDDVSADFSAYHKYDLKNATDDILEVDTFTFSDGNHFHAGVVKAFYEFFGNDHIFIKSHHKAYHIKKN
jgi:hypothetical protein